MNYAIIQAELKFRSVYVCCRCGKAAAGTTTRTDVKVATLGQLMAVMEGMQQRAAYMPVGWSSHPGDLYRCQGCGE